jgi:Fe-S cluster assembly protein SufB
VIFMLDLGGDPRASRTGEEVSRHRRAGDATTIYATLNSAVFTDGSFVYMPKGVRCPMELSTYFRINEKNTGQFERTLIIADKGAYVSYLEGCTAPMRDENQLHAAVVELVALDDAEIKYSTVQNWYPGDKDGKGGIYNFVTKRGDCRGDRSKISWTQVETGSAITWKYPSCILRGDDSGRVLFDRRVQRLPAGRHRHQDDPSRQEHEPDHLQGHRRRLQVQNTYRGLVSAIRKATECAQLHAVRLAADRRQVRRAHRALYREATRRCVFEHEATTSKISDDQLFYARSAASARRKRWR